MNERKSLNIALLLLSLITLTSSLALAAHECTKQVTRSDGTKDIDVDCTSSYTLTNSTLDPYYLHTVEDNLFYSYHSGLQDYQDKMADASSPGANAEQITADTQEKEQEAIDAERTRQQDQEDRAANSRL